MALLEAIAEAVKRREQASARSLIRNHIPNPTDGEFIQVYDSRIRAEAFGIAGSAVGMVSLAIQETRGLLQKQALGRTARRMLRECVLIWKVSRSVRALNHVVSTL